MYGIEAINTHNGWAISAVGITIVFSGLVMLSLVISQLHKVLALYENPEKIKKWFSREPVLEERDEIDLSMTEEQKEVVKQYALLARTMEDHFSLPRLLKLAQISGLKNPHSNLNLLLKSGIVFSDKSGWFCWNQELFEKAV